MSPQQGVVLRFAKFLNRNVKALSLPRCTKDTFLTKDENVNKDAFSYFPPSSRNCAFVNYGLRRAFLT